MTVIASRVGEPGAAGQPEGSPPAPQDPLPSLDPLLRLHERGANGLKDILRMAVRGDWRTRALCLSAAGRIARAESSVQRLWRWFARRVPTLRRRFPTAGYRGKYVKNDIANGLVDRSWAVRVAAALALGECRAPSKVANLRHQLAAPYRPERIAAAAALVCCGETLAQEPLLAGALPAPARIGDATRTIDFLENLASCHADVLAAWLRLDGQERPTGTAASDWAAFLAGPVPVDTYSGPDAEIQRYDPAGETEYLLTKPFSRFNRAQNVRLLHSFLVASEHLRVPPGGRILDLGGGSAWVSELLAKLGFRPFTLDLSSGLLSVGQRRFAREGLTPRFLVGDMTRLPVATGSMEAVIVMDALHHVPDVPAVFREAYRVLGAGGQFLLAEPGEGHSETEKSRSEMLQYGVQEREIHLFEAVGYGRDAGFDDVRAVPHYVPGISMTPENVQQAMKTPADEWTIHLEDRPGYFAPFLLQSMFDRPIMVFRKGKRPLDSRMPHILKAEIAPRLRRDRRRVSGTVAVRNVGDTNWLGSGDAIGQVYLGLQLLSGDHRLLDIELNRTRLGTHVPPGAALEVDVALMLPDPATAYVLKIDLVDEGICWFEDVGSRPVYLPV